MQKCQNAKSQVNASTKCDIECSLKLERKDESLKSFLTPYFTSKLKEIASKIRSNACKRFKTKHYDGQVRLVFWSDFKQISDASKDKSISTKEDLTIKEVDLLTKKQRAKIFRLENARAQMNRKTKDILLCLKTHFKNRLEIEYQVRALKAKNNKTSLLISYCQQLSLSKQQSQQVCQNIKAKILNTQHEMSRVYNCIQQIPILDQLIAQNQYKYSLLGKRLAQLEQRVDKLINQRIPNQLQMIHCMFYIGILSQQIHILILQKKQKANQKLMQNCDKVVNKSFKIHQKLTRREVHIECNKSDTVELKIFIAIFMHCKSLTISNIVTIMNSLSFFSDQFKQLYSYELFQSYLSTLIERLKLNTIKQIDFTNQQGEGQLLKKKLVIITQPQHFELIKWILRIYQIQDGTYSLYLCPYQMIIEVQTQTKNHLAQKQEVILCECNQLKMNFVNTVLPNGKLKSK